MDDVARQVADAVKAVRSQGWVVLGGLVDDDALDAAEDAVRRLLVDTSTGRDDFEGHHTRRVYAMPGKTRAGDPFLVHPVVTGVCQSLLDDGFRVSSATTIAIGPGEVAQSLHYDAQVYPLPRPEPEVVVNSMWALTPFTEENGATRLVPDSHRWPTGKRPESDVATIPAEMPRGSVLLYSGSLWHGGGANVTGDEVRIGLNFEYAAGWVRQQENQYLVLPPERTADVPDEVLSVLGYATSPPFLGYVDARDPLRWLARNGYRQTTSTPRDHQSWPLDD